MGLNASPWPADHMIKLHILASAEKVEAPGVCVNLFPQTPGTEMGKRKLEMVTAGLPGFQDRLQSVARCSLIQKSDLGQLLLRCANRPF